MFECMEVVAMSRLVGEKPIMCALMGFSCSCGGGGRGSEVPAVNTKRIKKTINAA